MIRRILVFLISLLLILNSTLTNAYTFNQWLVPNNPTAIGASMLFNGSKGAVTSSVLVTPNAAQVAKVLRGGAAGIALKVAVDEILGAVDWVMDPANNQVIYNKPKNITDLNDPARQYYYTDSYTQPNAKFTTLNAACASILKTRGWKLGIDADCILDGNRITLRPVRQPTSSYGDHGYRFANPAYDPTTKKPSLSKQLLNKSLRMHKTITLMLSLQLQQQRIIFCQRLKKMRLKRSLLRMS